MKTQQLIELEEKWKYKKLQLPSDDRLIMLRLRELNEPITLFAETKQERKERLRKILMEKKDDEIYPQCYYDLFQKEYIKKNELYYTEGTEELVNVRKWIVFDSLLRAQDRKSMKFNSTENNESINSNQKEKEKQYQLVSSTFGDDYRLFQCQIHNKRIITGGYDKKIKEWNQTNSSLLKQITVQSPIYSISLSPIEEAPIDYVVGLQNGNVEVIIKENDETLQLQCHSDRINSLDFHPSGRFLLTSSFDSLIKLWDLENGNCVVEHTGHVGSIRSIQWHCDGGIFASGGSDNSIHLFDIRCGKQISLLQGHSSTVTCLDWHCDGGVLCSSSDDNTIKLWDIRMQKCGYTIPAHNNIITSVHFNSNGTELLSSSFDQSIKLWNVENWKWKLVKQFTDHSKPITCCKWIDTDDGFVSCGFDKVWKLYLSL